jgi:DNA-binding winged helix-turn-helix (wHTH) protein
LTAFAATTVYEFAGFRFDPKQGLSRAGRRLRVPQKELRGLALLLARRGEVVTRDEYVRHVWLGGEASEDSISRSVYLLRRALAHGIAGEVIETVYASGYRLAVPVREVTGSPGARAGVEQGVLRAARETYRVGLALAGRGSAAELQAAVRGFRRAADLDETYAEPWIALAECHVAQAVQGYVAPRLAGAQAAAAAARALALDAQASAALAVRAWVRGVLDACVAEGLAGLDHATDLDPCGWFARFCRAWLLPATGEWRQAVDQAELACELSPLHPGPRALLGSLLFCSGEVAGALQRLRESARELDEPMEVLRVLASVAAYTGHWDEAREAAWRLAVTDAATERDGMVLAEVLARTGDAPAARRVLQRWVDAPANLPTTHLAAVHVALGDVDSGAATAAAARQAGCPYALFAAGDPRFASLRPARGGAATAVRAERGLLALR